MLTAVLLCIIAVYFTYRLIKFMFDRPPNFPPGPPRLPLIDSYLFLLLTNYKHMYKATDVLCKYYKTNILGCHFASIPTIIVNDAESVREALFTREFDGKPPLLLALLREPEFKIRGVFFSDGQLWKEQRRYMLRYMRDFGFGRRFQTLELESRDEFKLFIDIAKNGPVYDHEKEYFKDGLVLTPRAFCPYLVNIFMKVVLNEKVPRQEQHIFNEIIDVTLDFQRSADTFGRIFSHIPIFSKLFPKLSSFDRLRSHAMKLHAFIKEIIDQQIATYDSGFERSLIDMYISEMRKAETAGNDSSTFKYEQLVFNVVDFFFPALTTVAFQATHLFHLICLFPEIQQKIQNEIDEVVGQGALPTLDDRVNLPYTEASIRETMRFLTLLPSGLPHQSMDDAKFMGYDIPKGSLVITNLNGCNMDPAVWEKPDQFMPERFLDKNGKLCLKLDRSLPFGAGKRLCAGETFARNSMFLFTTAVLQNFVLKAPEGKPLPNISDTSTGLIVSSRDFWLEFVPRT